MTFANSRAKVLVNESQLKAQLEAKLSLLGQKIDEAEKHIKEYNVTEEMVQAKKLELSRLNDDIKRATKDLNELNDATASGLELKLQLNKETQGLLDIQATKKEVEEAYELLAKKNTDIEEMFNKRMLNLEALEKAKQVNIALLENQYQQLSNDYDKKNASIKEVLSSLTLEIEEKETELLQLTQEKLALDLDIDNSRKHLMTLQEDKDYLLEGLKKQRLGYEDWEKGEHVKLEAKQKDLERREGDLSTRESILESKTEKLRAYKNQLEVFYNRKFDEVII